LRVWDTQRGRLERELRRGVDRAEMWGVEFEDGFLHPTNLTGQKRKNGKSRSGRDQEEMQGTPRSSLEGGNGEVRPPRAGEKGDHVEDKEEARRRELRRKGGRVVGWSDKGTIHIWESDEIPSSSKA
jgi:hypothetical protein